MMQRNNIYKVSDRTARRRFTTGLIDDHKTINMKVKLAKNILE